MAVGEALSPELAGRIEQMDWQLLSSGEPALDHITHTRPDGQIFTLVRRARRLGKPGSHYIAVSLSEDAQGDGGETLDRFEAALEAQAGLLAGLQPSPPEPLRNVLFLTDTKRQDQALKLALRAHGADLCLVRDVPEFAAFLPAAVAAGVAIDLVVIDFEFDSLAFNIAAANNLNFRMLPEGADESTVMAEILTALPLPRHVLDAPSIEPPSLPSEIALTTAPDLVPLEPPRLDVLAVEDNPVNRMVLEQMLGSLSVSFRIAGSAAEGLADYAEMAPRLVLADTTLPDLAAGDFVLRLRHIDPASRIVALVPADTEDNHRQATAAGFDHSLSKPLSAETLEALIPDLLAIGGSASGVPTVRMPLS